MNDWAKLLSEKASRPTKFSDAPSGHGWFENYHHVLVLFIHFLLHACAIASVKSHQAELDGLSV